MKMIMPIASPAAVSVIQVGVEPMNGRAATASAGTSASGIQSTCGSRSDVRGVAAIKVELCFIVSFSLFPLLDAVY